MKKKRKIKPLKEEEDELSEEDITVPLSTLIINKPTPVKIRDMADYGDVFYAIENTVLQVWEEDRRIRDRDVLFAYTSLLKNFDKQPNDSLASDIAKNVKACLLFRKQDKQKDYTRMERSPAVFLCLLPLPKIIGVLMESVT